MRLFQLVAAAAFALSSLAGTAAEAREYRPVVFIPGLMGSKLANAQNEPVWGSFGDVQGRFEQLSFPRDASKDRIRATGILDDFKVLFGYFGVQAYSPVVDFLKGTVGGKLVPFPYDWRQSNFQSACDLVKFIGERPNLSQAALGTGGITLVTHSMGGLVGRVFISYRAPSGTAASAANPCPHQYNVTLFMPIAAPFNGAGQALKTFTDRMSTKWKLVRLDEDDILSVFYTIPSVYELLPRYPHCCRDVSGGRPTSVDIFNIDNWRKFRWVPRRLQGYAKNQRVAFIQNRLDAARRLQAIVETKLPPDVRFVSIWGYNQTTSTVVSLNRTSPDTRPSQDWSNVRDGDDTVPELSGNPCRATADGGSDNEACNASPDIVAKGTRMWRFPNSHLGLLSDDRVLKTIKFALDAYGSTVAGARSSETEEEQIPDDIAPFLMSAVGGRSGGDESLASVEFVSPQQELSSDSVQTVAIKVLGADGKPLAFAEGSQITSRVEAGNGSVLPSSLSMMSAPGQFGITFRTPVGPNVVSVRVGLPAGDSGVEPRAETMFVVSPPVAAP